MSLLDMRLPKKPFLAPSDVAAILKCAPYSLNVQAKEDITKLPFPCFMLGTRLKIPRETFIEWAEKMGL